MGNYVALTQKMQELSDKCSSDGAPFTTLAGHADNADEGCLFEITALMVVLARCGVKNLFDTCNNLQQESNRHSTSWTGYYNLNNKSQMNVKQESQATVARLNFIPRHF